MIGVYHSKDFDGFTSGFIIKMKYPNAKMIGYDYGEEFDISCIDSPVIMADVSLPMDTMKAISDKCGGEFIWIDHHISAIKDYQSYSEKNGSFCEVVFDQSISACEGTWKRLFPELRMPWAVKLLGEYDTWRHFGTGRWEDEIAPFQLGLKARCNKFEEYPEEIFANNELVLKIIEEGKVIRKFQKLENQKLCEKKSFEATLKGKKALCLNSGNINSEAFKGVFDPLKHDLMLAFSFDGKKFDATLYTTREDVDCSVIAKSLGGGGHRQAAGFEIKNIFEILTLN